MLHTDQISVVRHLGSGKIGLEKEGLRITGNGFMAQSRDPFVDVPCIVRDFCENQTEINTPVKNNVHDAMECLDKCTKRIRETLRGLPEPELLWPFSNPPYIRREADIPVAQYEGEERDKTEYRNYLADRYGKYKMTFSGIHFNYSFSEELLKAEYEIRRAGGKSNVLAENEKGAAAEGSYQEFKNTFYVSLAAKALTYNWLIVAATAASPLLDCSYVEKEKWGSDVFNGMGSTRCSELGYWNFFTPVLDYGSLETYADSVRNYITFGLIKSSSELYFPIRLKPPGKYDIVRLRDEGVSHIELRMIDLNPLTPVGLDERDAEFIRLLLIYLAALPDQDFPARDQIQAIQNTKNAARYDLKTVNIVLPGEESTDAVSAALQVIDDMRKFYRGIEADMGEVEPVLQYQADKFEDPEKRYAWQLRREYSGGFVEKGLELARKYA